MNGTSIGRYTSSCGDRSLWFDKREHEDKLVNLGFRRSRNDDG